MLKYVNPQNALFSKKNKKNIQWYQWLRGTQDSGIDNIQFFLVKNCVHIYRYGVECIYDDK